MGSIHRYAHTHTCCVLYKYSYIHTYRVLSYTYRMAKTHRMPGRAASGGALVPELAVRHRGSDHRPY